MMYNKIAEIGSSAYYVPSTDQDVEISLPNRTDKTSKL